MTEAFNIILNRFFAEDSDSFCMLNEIPCLTIKPTALIRVLMILRDHERFDMEQMVDLFAVDYLGSDPRFEVTIHLLSHRLHQRLFIKVKTNDKLPSVSGVYKNANWYEREAYDLFGLQFDGHPDLRRILTDYDFEGHPLRKDFPLSGYTEVLYNPETGKVEQVPVHLEQPYRTFDFESSWKGGRATPPRGRTTLQK